MNIKIAHTEQGAIMGDFEENGSVWKVHKPVYVIPQANNVALLPILGMCEDEFLNLSRTEILFCAGVFTPLAAIRNHYSAQFGSGIQLVS